MVSVRKIDLIISQTLIITKDSCLTSILDTLQYERHYGIFSDTTLAENNWFYNGICNGKCNGLVSTVSVKWLSLDDKKAIFSDTGFYE